MDWVIPTEEVLARLSRLVEQPELPSKKVVRPQGKFRARLRWFASQFRHAA
jgi:hypothetical protein